MQHPKNIRFHNQHISLPRGKRHSSPHKLPITEIHLLRQPYILLHRDTKIRHSGNLLLTELMRMLVLIVDFELGQPQILNVLTLVSDDIVEE